jgi:hypothetical protein
MISNARIVLVSGIHRNALGDLRHLTPVEFNQLAQAAEEFAADGHVEELRAMQADLPEFNDPLSGFTDHPDHIEVREALRAAAVAYNTGHLGVRFGLEIDVDETFGPVGSASDSPRPTCVIWYYEKGVLKVHYNVAPKVIEAGEPMAAEYLIADVLDDTFLPAALVGKGLRENEMDFRLTLSYEYQSALESMGK